jgi:hypothetical protein
MTPTSEAVPTNVVKPTCTLSWIKTEAGLVTEGGQSFWKPLAECKELARRIAAERRKLGGTWVFRLTISDDVEVSLEPEAEGYL